MVDTVTIQKQVDKRLSELGVSAAAASREAGLSEDYIRNMRRGLAKSPNIESLNKLANRLGVSLPSLLGFELAQDDYVRVPTHGFRAGMGGGGIIMSDKPDGNWPLSGNYARRVRLDGADLISFEVEGDSMSPTLESGDQVMVDKRDKNAARGGVFAVFDSDTLVVKRLERIPETEPPRLRLISDNKFHSDYDVMAENTNIIVRVVWYARRI